MAKARKCLDRHAASEHCDVSTRTIYAWATDGCPWLPEGRVLDSWHETRETPGGPQVVPVYSLADLNRINRRRAAAPPDDLKNAEELADDPAVGFHAQSIRKLCRNEKITAHKMRRPEGAKSKPTYQFSRKELLAYKAKRQASSRDAEKPARAHTPEDEVFKTKQTLAERYSIVPRQVEWRAAQKWEVLGNRKPNVRRFSRSGPGKLTERRFDVNDMDLVDTWLSNRVQVPTQENEIGLWEGFKRS